MRMCHYSVEALTSKRQVDATDPRLAEQGKGSVIEPSQVYIRIYTVGALGRSSGSADQRTRAVAPEMVRFRTSHRTARTGTHARSAQRLRTIPPDVFGQVDFENYVRDFRTVGIIEYILKIICINL